MRQAYGSAWYDEGLVNGCHKDTAHTLLSRKMLLSSTCSRCKLYVRPCFYQYLAIIEVKPALFKLYSRYIYYSPVLIKVDLVVRRSLSWSECGQWLCEALPFLVITIDVCSGRAGQVSGNVGATVAKAKLKRTKSKGTQQIPSVWTRRHMKWK